MLLDDICRRDRRRSFASVVPAMAAWPEKPIRIVVPFGPGGTTDILARTLQKVLDEQQASSPSQSSIQNVGGHFSVGARQVMTAAARRPHVPGDPPGALSGEVVDPGARRRLPQFRSRGADRRLLLPPDRARRFALHDAEGSARRRQGSKPNTIVTGVNIGALNHMMALFMEQGFPGAKFRYAQIGGGGENFAAIMGGHTQADRAVELGVPDLQGQRHARAGIFGAGALSLEPEHPDRARTRPRTSISAENFWFAPKGTPQEAIEGMAERAGEGGSPPTAEGVLREAGADRPVHAWGLPSPSALDDRVQGRSSRSPRPPHRRTLRARRLGKLEASRGRTRNDAARRRRRSSSSVGVAFGRRRGASRPRSTIRSAPAPCRWRCRRLALARTRLRAAGPSRCSALQIGQAAQS